MNSWRKRGNRGSSPLSRGIRAPDRGYAVFARIIPALAGNTIYTFNYFAVAKDHPRSRGEYDHGCDEFPGHRGSSPLSRGIHGPALDALGSERIIPALAGNTLSLCQLPSPLKDHPRSRGEYPRTVVTQDGVLGSSPLSRGIPIGAGPITDGPRIIPALAGNTLRVWLRAVVRTDHPRSRGEYFSAEPSTASWVGSSPLSRGIHMPTIALVRGGRIIPALAGNTDEIRLIQLHNGDHPRSRGEYRPWMRRTTGCSGSSPLSRGILQPSLSNPGPSRIIPALAGNTPSDCLSPLLRADHPRSRGEYNVEG